MPANSRQPTTRRRASINTRSSSSVVHDNPLASPRAARAEKRKTQRRLEDAQKRIEELEHQVNVLTNNNEYYTFEERGRNLFQDRWNQVGASRAIFFPFPASCTCASVETHHSVASMPGVCGQLPMTSGLYSQPILVRGIGYTMLGLVGSDAEKRALKTCEDFSLLPKMSIISCGGIEQTLVLEVDMLNHTAQLHTPGPGGRMGVSISWDNLPAQVWVAVAMKRNSEREAVLLPGTHWDIAEVTV